jgi:hypothetical protein
MVVKRREAGEGAGLHTEAWLHANDGQRTTVNEQRTTEPAANAVGSTWSGGFETAHASAWNASRQFLSLHF